MKQLLRKYSSSKIKYKLIRTKLTFEMLALSVWMSVPVIFYIAVDMSHGLEIFHITALLLSFILTICYAVHFDVEWQRSRNRTMLFGFLDKFQNCQYEEFSPSDYDALDTDAYPLPRFAEITPNNPIMRLSDVVTSVKVKPARIFVVRRGDAAEKARPPRQLVSYRASSGTTGNYIFLRDVPEDITLFHKFFLLHELGHANHWMAGFQKMHFQMIDQTQMYFIIYLISTQIHVLTGLIFLVYLFLTYREYWSHLKRRKRRNIMEEIHADWFAFRHLSSEERRAMRTHIDNNEMFFKYSSENVEIAEKRREHFDESLYFFSETLDLWETMNPRYYLLMTLIWVLLGVHIRASLLPLNVALLVINLFIFLGIIVAIQRNDELETVFDMIFKGEVNAKKLDRIKQEEAPKWWKPELGNTT